MNNAQRRPKSPPARTTAAKKSTKAKAVGAGQVKTATKARAAAARAGKVAAKPPSRPATETPAVEPSTKPAEPAQAIETAGARSAKKTARRSPEPLSGVRQRIGATYVEEIEVLIRQRAYEFWEQRGRGHGRALEDWLAAEREFADETSKVAKTRPGKTARTRAQKSPK